MCSPRLLVVLLTCSILALAPRPSSAGATLIGTWGSLGSGPGQFQTPYGIATDGTSFVYVADQGNHRIQKFTLDGQFVMAWGVFGSAPDQMSHPSGIHLANGELYVTQHTSHHVSRYTTDGVFLGSFGIPGTGPGQLFHPVAITSDPDGNVYIANSGNNRIQKFSSTGTPLGAWGSYGTAPGRFITPYGIERSPDGFIYVGEYVGSRMQAFTTDGGFLRKWGSSGPGPGQFNAAEGITFDSNGNLYVCDTGNDRVQKFTPDGDFINQFSIPGVPGSRSIPSDIAVDAAGNLYVVSYGSARILKYAVTNEPPTCASAAAVLAAEWPANGRFVPVHIDVRDPDGDRVSIRVTGVTQDEPLVQDPDAVDLESVQASDGSGYEPTDATSEEPAFDGHPETLAERRHGCPDARIDSEGRAWVRLERLPRGQSGNGRVYEITFDASDGAATCTGTVQVCVPLRRGGDCRDDGQVENSLGPCPPDAGAIEAVASAEIRSIQPHGGRVRFEFGLPAAAEIAVEVFDVAGRRVATLDRAIRERGTHTLEWDAGGASRGVYFCRLTSGSVMRSRSFVVR